MHRNKFLNLLDGYTPQDSNEIKFKEDIINFVREHEDCFERSMPEGHITGSAWILDSTGNQALLTHHTKLDRWFQLGGHCDGDSDVLAVAIKEAQEESGIDDIVAISENIFDIDIHLIPDNSREKAHYHYDIRFLLQIKQDKEVKCNSESKALKWIGKDIRYIPTDNPSVIRMFNKWIEEDLSC